MIDEWMTSKKGMAVTAVLVMASVIFLACWLNGKVERQRLSAYSGWVKTTGHTNVTFGEWKSMLAHRMLEDKK